MTIYLLTRQFQDDMKMVLRKTSDSFCVQLPSLTEKSVIDLERSCRRRRQLEWGHSAVGASEQKPLRQ